MKKAFLLVVGSVVLLTQASAFAGDKGGAHVTARAEAMHEKAPQAPLQVKDVSRKVSSRYAEDSAGNSRRSFRIGGNRLGFARSRQRYQGDGDGNRTTTKVAWAIGPFKSSTDVKEEFDTSRADRIGGPRVRRFESTKSKAGPLTTASQTVKETNVRYTNERDQYVAVTDRIVDSRFHNEHTTTAEKKTNVGGDVSGDQATLRTGKRGQTTLRVESLTSTQR